MTHVTVAVVRTRSDNIAVHPGLTSLLLLSGLGVTTYAVHPGLVATEAARYADDSLFSGAQWLFDNILVYFIKTPEQGAQTTIHCAVSDEAGKDTGLYYR